MQTIVLHSSVIGSLPYLGDGTRVVSQTGAVYDWNGSSYASGGGGGASAFVDLTDCPATITPNALLVGNAAGSGVVQLPWVLNNAGPTYRELLVQTENVNGGHVQVQDEAGDSRVTAYVDSTLAALTVSNEAGGGGRLDIEATNAGVRVWVQFGSLILEGLPTSNPAVAGALWNDAGTLKISAG